MNSYPQLPEGYRELLHIDLQKDQKLMLLVNGLAVVICAVMLAVAAALVPISYLVEVSDLLAFGIKAFVICVGMVVYLVLHEAVHGFFMRHYCSAPVFFGFTGMYAYAASKGYFCRKHYLIIGLSPVVLWGLVLAVLNTVVPVSWFYVVYLIQVINVSGAAGDLYVTWKMLTMPSDILVHDTGVAMTVYSREG